MLFTKLRRDIRQNFSQFFTIFCMVFLAVFAFVGVSSYSDGMKYSAEKEYERYNLQDLWIYGEGFSAETMEKIRSLDHVADAERMLTVSMTMDAEEDGADARVPLEITFLDAEDPEKNISSFCVRDGAAYDPDAAGIWINYTFAKERNIRVGDTLTLHFDVCDLEETVLGIISVPDHVYTVQDESVIFQSQRDFGWGFLSMKEFPKQYIIDQILKSEEFKEVPDLVGQAALMHRMGMSYDAILDLAKGMGLLTDGEEEESFSLEDADLETAASLAGKIKDGTADAEEKEAFLRALDPALDEDLAEAWVYPIAVVDVEGTAPVFSGSSREKEDFAARVQEVRAALYEIEGVSAVTERDVSGSYATLKAEAEEGDTYSGMFSFLFIFIAALSVITTMNRFVRRQRIQIGTLKALGFRNRRISLHYVSFGFFVSLAAAVLGLVLGGPVLGTPFLRMEMEMFDLPLGRLYFLPKNYIVAAAIVAAITLVSFLSCRKILKEKAAQTLRQEIPNVRVKRQGGKGLTSRLPFSTKWNLRDISRNKARCAMAVAGILGSTTLIVLAFGMQDSLLHYLDWEFGGIQSFGSKLNLGEDITEEELSALFGAYGDATTQSVAIEYEDSAGRVQTSVITVNDSEGLVRISGHDMTTYDIEDGVPGRTEGSTDDPGAICITEKLGKSAGLSLGGTVRWHVMGEEEWQESRVASVCRDPQLQQFSMTRTAYEGLGFEYRPDSLYTKEVLEDVKDSDLAGVSAIQSIAALRQQMNSMLEMISSMIWLFIGIAAFLGFIIIYNMGILSLSEKMYQFATLKVLGFRNSRLSRVYMEQNIWLTVIGIALGLPGGFLMTDLMFRYAIGDNYDFFANINLRSYLIASAGTLLIMLFTGAVLTRHLRRIDMVSSLKANE